MKVPVFSQQATCRQIKTKSLPPPLFNHTTLATPTTIIIYAGQRGKSKNEDKSSNRQALTLLSDMIWEYNLESESFERIWIDSRSVEPPVRMDCALAWLDPASDDEAPHTRMIMYGGWGLEDDDLADVWIFNFKTKIWTQIHTRQEIGMSGHKIFMSNGEMYAFKAQFDANHELPIYIFNLTTLNWRKMKLQNTTFAPSSRESFLGCLSTDCMGNKLQGNPLKYGWLMFGGNSEKYGTTNDLHHMRRQKEGVEWEELFAFGDLPSLRTGSQMVWLCGRWVFLFGGDVAHETEIEVDVSDNSLYVLDRMTMEWKRIKLSGKQLQGRVGHSLNIVFHPQQQVWKLIIFGGKSSTENITDTIYEISLTHDFENSEPEMYEELKEDPMLSDFHSMSIQDDPIVRKAKELISSTYEMKKQPMNDMKKNEEKKVVRNSLQSQDLDSIYKKINATVETNQFDIGHVLPGYNVGTKPSTSPATSVSCNIL